ncbi:MAG: GAF domain-containing protein [Cyanobacteria bacterium Co-bin8]|nr:GAF domain-containing protein [Cyanobacteria bacterium Co-bin8]
MYQQRESTLSGQQEISLQRAINRIRRSLDLSAILETTVEEVRACLSLDRVMLYQFHADASGEVVAETIRDRCLPPLLGLNFPADDIPLWARELYLRARQRSIVNVHLQQIGFSPLLCPENGEPLAVEDIHYRTVSPCHVEYLTAMGVQASLVVPILHYDLQQQQVEPQLWGLLVAHHAQPRSFKVKELRLVQQIADQAALAIAQATLLVQAQQQAQREAALNKITSLLHSLPKIQLHEALEETVKLLQGVGGRLYLNTDHHLFAQVYTVGKQPILLSQDHLCPVEHHPLWQQTVHPEGPNDRIWAIDDLTQEAALQPIAEAFQPQRLRSLLVVPLQYNQVLLGYLSVFRHETETETWWAGRFNPAQEQQQPRQSFAAWRELKRGQIRGWQPRDIDLAQALQRQFSMAIQHHSLYEQVQTLNSSLERQVQERTAELQQSLESAHLLRQVTDQIRSTLDYQLVLRTIVREVRSLLNTDRVVIYKFARNYQGTVVVEDVQEEWISILHEAYNDICFPLEYALQYRDQNRVSVVNDVEGSSLHPCHIQFLQSLQVKSNLVVPIRIGSQLWGLLVAHECRAPRQWKATEIALLQQLAEQAEIAIKQAKLYERSCITAETAMKQAIRLQQALQDLKQTQTQLIHTEKMSSLGQMVAGVAHEINNPINFIHGNVVHAQNYLQDLLSLVDLYQQGYAYTDPQVQKRISDMDLGFMQEDLPKLLSSMLLGSDRIRQIVLTLRNFSRLDEAKMKPVDIHDGLDSTLLILQNRLKAQPEHLAVILIKEYSDLPLVECYAGQLNQVFMNVINNAIDALHQQADAQTAKGFTAATGTIVIKTHQLDADWVEIAIKDNGPGMSEATHSKLFDPFFTTKPVGEGTGLGLSISYQIVEKHGGKLICLSAPGEGAEFKIQLPIQGSRSRRATVS